MFIGAEFRCQDHLGATAVQVTGWFAGRECERWASTDVHAGIIRIGTSTLMRRSEWLFGASGALAGAGSLCRRRASIIVRLGSNHGGRLTVSPDLWSGTSVAKSGPSVAMAKFTPHGPLK